MTKEPRRSCDDRACRSLPAPFGKTDEAVFFAEPERELLGRVAFILCRSDAVGSYAGVPRIDAEEFFHRRIDGVPVVDERYRFFCRHFRLLCPGCPQHESRSQGG